MYDEILNQKLIEELKQLLLKAEELEEDKDAYCEFMKSMILNTYSAN